MSVTDSLSVWTILGYNASNPLIFTRIDFWIFLAAVFACYIFVVRKMLLRTIFLLSCSLYFYYKSCGLFFLLILFSIGINYWFALWISESKTKAVRKLLLILSVGVNLFLLGYFKYTAFFIDTVNTIFGVAWKVPPSIEAILASWLKGEAVAFEDIVLPVGISFYTFQAISYVVDVYRRTIPALRSIADFGLYLSFFPALVAGPIVRATEFIPQIRRPYNVSSREASHALFLILVGLFKKIVLSDYISLNLVDRVFNNPSAYTGLENLLASYGYTMQIYCDFSGYTDIAIGVALLLGFRLSINFNFPYRAKSLTDFWRRWHISLSSWLRDYLYIPLGGSRHGRWVMFGALFTTMLLGGLWHGAHAQFVFWGCAHGVGLIISKIIDRLPSRILVNPFFIVLRYVLTFHYVVFLWIFFRAQSFETAQQVLTQILFEFNGSVFVQALMGYSTVFALMFLGYGLHWMPIRWGEGVRGAFIKSPLWVKGIVTLLVVFLLLNVQSADLQPFIYFNF